MDKLTSLVDIPRMKSYNSLRSTQPLAKCSTIIQFVSYDQRGNNASFMALWAGKAALQRLRRSLEQLAQVIKINSNLQ